MGIMISRARYRTKMSGIRTTVVSPTHVCHLHGYAQTFLWVNGLVIIIQTRSAVCQTFHEPCDEFNQAIAQKSVTAFSLEFVTARSFGQTG